MSAVIEFTLGYGPIVLATIYPFLRVLRGKRIARSFFICWGLIIVLRCIFWFGVSSMAGHFSGDLAEDLSLGNLEAIFLRAVISGWFYAGATVLIGFVICLFFHRPAPEEISRIELVRKHKWFKIVALSVLVVVGMVLKYFASTQEPPKEAKLINAFYAHRPSYERLREMLQNDSQIRTVATWGVETRRGFQESPPGILPIEKYHEYLALLKDAGAMVAWRGDGAHPEIGICVWSAGFAGDTVHIWVAWREDKPGREAASFDRYFHNFRSSDSKGRVYRQIDGNWYLCTDIGIGY